MCKDFKVGVQMICWIYLLVIVYEFDEKKLENEIKGQLKLFC